jgi:transposase-like protein
LSGVSFRALGQAEGCGAATAYRRVKSELEKLPLCIDVTRQCCQKFSGVLLVDGKYIAVKRYERKIPVLYGVDYTSHDIPHFKLAQAESYLVCKRFFESLKLTNYSLQAIVSDDNHNIYTAAKYVFPNVVVQLCHVHFLRNMRALLDPKHLPVHQYFFSSLCDVLVTKRSKEDFEKRASLLMMQFSADPACQGVLIELSKKQPLLQGYLQHRGTPTTTNLIESLNSHLEARVKPLKGFESFRHADVWLNAYFLKRRTTPFTDCEGKFRRLNGKTPLSQTKKSGIDIPIFF